MVFIYVAGIIFVIDLLLKESIEKQDPETFPRELEKSQGRILLYRNHNAGFPFGFLEEKPQLVKNIPLIMTSALAGILLWLLPKKGQLLEKTALTFAIGGALSNLYDRMVRGYVIDYFSIQWKKLKKVVFNLGDLFIFAGAALLLISEVIQAGKEKSLFK
ncbi:MAG: signal peptidase II [Clostridiaceae bacterium]|nr:signal peptidase II [Clostridiaceae bacterium]